METASALLKAETAVNHVVTESFVDWNSALSSVARYGSLLRGLLRATRPAEEVVDRILGASAEEMHSTYEFTEKLLKDLRELGIEPPTIDDDFTQEYRFIKTKAETLGMLYVLEGSLLGGQYLGRQLKQRLGIGPEEGGCYYQGRGAATLARWRAFRSWLDDELASSDEQQSAVSAARRTFEIFGLALKEAARNGIAPEAR